jgi:NADH-quinone oxidoreductase subunit N
LITLDLLALAPLIVLGLTATFSMLWIGLSRRKPGAAQISISGILLAVCCLPLSAGQAPRGVTMLLQVDGYAIYYMALICLATAAVGLLALPYLRKHEIAIDEFYVLLPLAAAGGCAMVCARHFASLYLGLEVMSVALYGMVAYVRTSRLGTEAAVKYLIMAAVGAAFLLFGMALVYAELGSLALPQIAAATPAQSANGVLQLGFAMVLVGVGFKLSIVPFHLWTADVYQGAPAPVVAFLATVSKGAVFAFMLRYFAAPTTDAFTTLFNAFTLAAVASMFVGNLLALRQRNVKRMLAYSSIAHVGYMAIAFLAGGNAAIESGAAYLAAYFVTSLGTFGVVTLRSAETAGCDRDDWEDYRGLLYTRPALGFVFALMLFSLAGLPLTAGFIGKLYLVTAGIGSSSWALLAALIINSGIGLYYYLRLALAVCTPVEGAPAAERVPMPWSGAAVLGALTVALFWMGVFPAGLIGSIRHFVLSGH